MTCQLDTWHDADLTWMTGNGHGARIRGDGRWYLSVTEVGQKLKSDSETQLFSCSENSQNLSPRWKYLPHIYSDYVGLCILNVRAQSTMSLKTERRVSLCRDHEFLVNLAIYIHVIL
jgi:hypothetical protein